MCTLTFIPDKSGKVVITHNRDEHFQRPVAVPPAVYPVSLSDTAIYPKDPQSSGTWFAMHTDWVCCMLNGGFERHQCVPPYKRSRGTVIPDFLSKLNMEVFTQQFDPLGMEPFTFVAYHIQSKVLHQLVWDEKALHWQKPNQTKPHMWCSATLYNSEVRRKRKQVFERFIGTSPDAEAVFQFHQLHAGEQQDEGFFVNINHQIHTVAIMQCVYLDVEMTYRYQAF
jgi:uncharacterized protein with NRDE domain